MKHVTVSKGEYCGICLREHDRKRTATHTHKIGEEMLAYNTESKENRLAMMRHNWTQYVCCEHFGLIMGPVVKQWCNQNNQDD